MGHQGSGEGDHFSGRLGYWLLDDGPLRKREHELEFEVSQRRDKQSSFATKSDRQN